MRKVGLGCKDCTFCFVLVGFGVGVMDWSLEGALDASLGVSFLCDVVLFGVFLEGVADGNGGYLGLDTC